MEIGSVSGTRWEGAAQRTQGPAEPAAAEDAAAAQPEAKRDVCDISPDWEQAVDWEEQVKSYLERAASQYGRVDVVIADVSEKELQSYAAYRGPGAHLILSTDFLRRMAAGAESFYKGKALLDGLFRQLSGQGKDGTGAGAYVSGESVRFWSAAETDGETANPWKQKQQEFDSLFKMMEDMRKRAEERKEKFQVHVSDSMFRSPAEALTRLARANTVGGVKMAMSMADRCICSLKLALALGPDRYKAKLRAAIAALEKVAVRGSRKIRDLGEEDDLRRRRKRAEQEALRKKAEQFRYELEQRQASRKCREHAQITEGQPWFYYQQEYMRRRQIRTPEETDPAAEGMPVGAESLAAVEAGGGAVSFAPADVAVSPAVEISI